MHLRGRLMEEHGMNFFGSWSMNQNIKRRRREGWRPRILGEWRKSVHKYYKNTQMETLPNPE